METHEIPSLKHLTSKKFFKPPKHANAWLEALGAPHVESFNFLISHGLKMIVNKLETTEFELPTGEKVGWKLVGCGLQPPAVHNSLLQMAAKKIMPTECRQRACSYKGQLTVQLQWWKDGEQKGVIPIPLGELPIMVKSALCHTSKMTPKQLVAVGEEEDLWGGYFITKGHERLIRMLMQNRSNYPIVMMRRSWMTRGNQFSDLGVVIRCVAEDQQAVTNVLHFVCDGSAKMMFSLEKNMYFAPLVLILKCLIDVTDEYIYQQLLLGAEDDHYYKSCVCLMLRRLHEERIHCQRDAKHYLGTKFRVKARESPPWATSADICDFIFRQCVLIQFNNNEDKFHLLCLLSRKLFAAKQGRILFESVDQVMMQEVQLGGYLYLQYLKECLAKWSRNLKISVMKKLAKQTNPNSKTPGGLTEVEILGCSKNAGSPENAMENFLATGNVKSVSGMAMMQDSGLTIVAENINRMRYMSHFRAVHRGSFFAKMRTTDARQLLPDAWGFICPVHTPDGAPCGLLNHLARHCHIVTEHIDTSHLPTLLGSLGMTPLGPGVQGARHYFVTLDSKVLGVVSYDKGADFVSTLRQLKTEGERIPPLMEVAFIPHEEDAKGQYPGIFLFSNKCRMMRPVLHLASQKIEMVGTLEQVYMNIAVAPSEIIPGVTTHLEISETTFLSNLACLIPMPDCNQSPRNMYQCQMGKQSMGTPTHAWHLVTENKMYRLQTPSSPLFKTAHYDSLNMDSHAMGVNAVVAVISYTGYDMEDAMTINKSSYERGFAHGSIYKTELIELEPGSFFAIDPDQPGLIKSIDKDGLPYIGNRVSESQPLYCYFDIERGSYQVRNFKGKEDVYIDSVKAYGIPVTTTRKQPHRLAITYRIPRNPSIGDKFASRAGQKGICSQKWPTEDLPFTESGLVPDIVFNPHGFPSRMTIAMMVELMAGKSAAMHGLQHDATPFRFNEQDTAIDYFGKLLQEAGYNYHGNERMYSGIDGREINVDIFFGIVYYQRLRHMVSDKWQVRSTGPVDQVTHQPLKGRKRGGGVRFGEMERDGLISHGAAFLLQDRLLNCSDKSLFHVCRDCGSLLSTLLAPVERDGVKTDDVQPLCRSCDGKSRVEEVEMPHVMRLLAAQLASINIKVKFELSPAKGTILKSS